MTVREYIIRRGITRLCHFTKSVSLPYIFNNELGIKSVKLLEAEGIEVKKNDYNRYDGKTDYLSCSIQYPNMYYFDIIRNNDELFKEWVVLLLNPLIMECENTLFCQTNAAFRSGRFLKYGLDGLVEMFLERSTIGNHLQDRTTEMPINTPTDAQAEVMIYSNIAVSNIIGMVCPTLAQANREFNRFEQMGIPITFDIFYSQEMFQKSFFYELKKGRLPKEDTFYIYKGDV